MGSTPALSTLEGHFISWNSLLRVLRTASATLWAIHTFGIEEEHHILPQVVSQRDGGDVSINHGCNEIITAPQASIWPDVVRVTNV